MVGQIKLKSEFDCPISSLKSYNKDIAKLGTKELRLLVLKIYLLIHK
jgi:hypothetical protein